MEPNGLLFLRADEAAALHRLDRTFAEWGTARGAEPVVGPALLPVAGLAKLDYYQNFPHQALTVSGLDLERRPQGEAATAITAFPPDQLQGAEVAPPPATCYAVYLGLEGTALERDTLVTLVGRCFRREEHYKGLRRLLGFHMREIVALGSQEFVEDHLERSSQRILAFAEALGLEMRKEPASDPFFDGEGPRAKLQMLSPVKYEFLVGDLAIGSVNKHRNFFGERCDIRIAGTGRPVFTSCVAFGLERWLAVLHERHGDWAAVATALDKAAVA
ncbi:aminoacyl--tRNA ligase-related protein [Streptomyces sp. NPDC059080]|uniref:aminoacyl--tRNA ligase-related protein n=1 Tax=Streptomyces sp. NPDC059080 TaxID=3346718 RepID=UPI0036797C2A